MNYDNQNYYERKYVTWKDGLLHLVITILLPLIPVVVYIISDNRANVYYYILLVTVVVSFMYEFLNTYKYCNRILKIENFVTSTVLIIMLVWDLVMMIIKASRPSEAPVMSFADYVLSAMFLVPVIVSVIEVIRSFIYDMEEKRVDLPNENIANGAKEV